jgi:CRISPR/Cas system-associated endonuclease/helicase Cas3
MGFHIVNIENDKLKHDYVETYEELSYVEFITNDSIIYQGEEHWKPFKVSDSDQYKRFAKGWFRAGIQAQELFKEQATNHGYILEMLNQDQKSFKSYTSNVNSVSIKRGDFLVRNFGNIEVDVKCRGFRIFNGKKHLTSNAMTLKNIRTCSVLQIHR